MDLSNLIIKSAEDMNAVVALYVEDSEQLREISLEINQDLTEPLRFYFPANLSITQFFTYNNLRNDAVAWVKYVMSLIKNEDGTPWLQPNSEITPILAIHLATRIRDHVEKLGTK